MSFFVAGAILTSAVIGGISSNDAANTQANAQTQGANTQQQMFNTINGQERSFIESGYNANATLADLLGLSSPSAGAIGNTGLPRGYLTQQFNPTQEQLDNYPGYQFALKTGGQAVRNADTPGVGALSGAALKDLMNFNVGTANQFYGQYFNQFQQQQSNIFSRLSGIAGLGQDAASNVGTAGTSLGTGIAKAQAAAGGSQAAGIVGSSNALTGAAVPLAFLMAGRTNNPADTFGGVNQSAGNDFSATANV